MHVTRGDPCECWEWQGTINTGYGRFTYRGKEYAAHRTSYEIHHGPIPDGLFVCHNCPDGDNPRCVNPSHLFLGTSAENTADRDQKGRQAKGTRSWNARLIESDILKIREMYSNGIPQKDLAVLFDMNSGTISSIIRGKSWRHIPGGKIKPKRPSLTKEQAEQIRHLAQAGTKRVDLANQFGVTYSTIKRIISGRSHA